MYFVITPEGRFGPVSRDVLLAWCREGRLLPDTILETQDTRRQLPVRDYLWQQDGRPTTLVVERLAPLPPEPWVQPDPEPSHVTTSPHAHPETAEYRVRVSLTPEEAANGAERKVVLTGYVASGGQAPSVLKTVAIPQQIVTAANPRVRYRNRNQGLQHPDGTGTDLVLLVEYDPNASPVRSPLIAAPKPGYPDVPDVPTPRPEPPKPEPPVQPNPHPASGPVGPTEIFMKVTRQLATTGGSLQVVLPSGRQRSVFLPPGVALRGTFKWVQMGEAKPEGGNCDLRITFQIE